MAKSQASLFQNDGPDAILYIAIGTIVAVHSSGRMSVARPRKKPPAEILHSEEEHGSVLFICFIPSKTKDGEDLPVGEDQQLWAEAVGDVLTEQFGGSTVMPIAKGKWRNDDGKIITEDVILIHSYASQSHAQDEDRLQQIAVILHRMGKRTK